MIPNDAPCGVAMATVLVSVSFLSESNFTFFHRGPIQAVCLTVCSKYKGMYGKYHMVKSLLVNSKFELKINVNLTQKLSSVVSAPLIGEFRLFEGF